MNTPKWKSGALWAWVAVIALVVISALTYTSVGKANGHNDKEGDGKCWAVKVDGDDAGHKVLKDGISGTPDEVSKKYMAAAKHDPSALVGLYNTSPLAKKGTLSEKDVVTADGKCYSEKGKQAWYALSHELASAKRSNGQAPANACNTFVVGGVASLDCGAISGDRKATKIVWSDGSVSWIMHRCANPVTQHPHPNGNCHTRGDCPTHHGNCHTRGDCPTHECKPPYVPYQGRCVKPSGQHDPTGSGGGDDIPTHQDVSEHPQGHTSGAPTHEPPPPVRPPGDPNGGSGDGGAPPPTTPDDDSDSGQTTAPDPVQTQCPSWPMC